MSFVPRRLLLLLLATLIGFTLQPTFAIPVPTKGSSGHGTGSAHTHHPAPAPVHHPAPPSTHPAPPSTHPAPQQHQQQHHASHSTPSTAASTSAHQHHAQGAQADKPKFSYAQMAAKPPPPPTFQQHLHEHITNSKITHHTAKDAHGQTITTHHSIAVPLFPGHKGDGAALPPHVLSQYAKKAFDVTHPHGINEHTGNGVFAATHAPGSNVVYIHSNIKSGGQRALKEKADTKFPGLREPLHEYHDQHPEYRDGKRVLDAEQGALMHSLSAKGASELNWKGIAGKHTMGVYGHVFQDKVNKQGSQVITTPCPMCQHGLDNLGIVHAETKPHVP